MTRELEVRTTRPADRAAILDVVRDAFTTEGRDGQEELDIVHAVWALEAVGAGLELVATIDGVVSGYVLASWGDLGGRRVVGIAPLAVSPAYQSIGVGTALMEKLIRRADDSGLPLMVLLGDPSYYQRFGFEPSGPLNICYPPAGPDSPHFQVRRLGAYTPALQGDFRYGWEIRHST